MVDAKSAYKKLKKLPNKNFLVECSDFGKFYGFVFSKHKPSPDEPFGSAYDCIDKETGEHFPFSPFDDFDLFDKAIPVSIEELI